MSLLRATIFSGVATAVRLASGLAVTKLLALYVGPGGFALLGNFANFTAMASLISSGGVTNGVTKYVAEYQANPQARQDILNAAFRIAAAFSIVVSGVVVLLREPLSRRLFGSEAYIGPILALGLASIPIAFGTLMLAVVNGEKRFGSYAVVNVSATIFGLLLTGTLLVKWGMEGAAYAMALGPIALLAASVPALRRSRLINMRNLLAPLRAEPVRKLARFSLMTLVSAISIPVTFIFIRNFLIEEVSLDSAGQWQGIWRISETYLGIVTTTLGVYYLPRLSELTEAKELREEILRGYRFLLPITAVAALAIYLLRETLVAILFTKQFNGMLDLFAFQLIGDFLKISSWILGYLTVAKSMTMLFVTCEIGFLISFAALTVLFVRAFGLVGVTYAYSLNYLLYLLTMVWVFRTLLLGRGKE